MCLNLQFMREKDDLEEAEYLNIKYSENYDLHRAFLIHLGNNRRVSRMDIPLFYMANMTDMYLKSHAKNELVIKGDKGKISGLMYRQFYVDLCKAFIEENRCTLIVSGTKKSFDSSVSCGKRSSKNPVRVGISQDWNCATLINGYNEQTCCTIIISLYMKVASM